jgi:two-component system, OmpR family, response regulator
MRLILVEDSERLQALLGEAVHDAGWGLDCFDDIATAQEAAATIDYDLALIDLGLPDGDGIDLVKHLRRQRFVSPILVITARNAIDVRVEALDAGADDYLLKPFNHRELLARCRALLRRAPLGQDPVITAGRLEFVSATGELKCNGDIIPVSPRERTLASILLRHAGSVVAKERLETALSDLDSETSVNAVELLVSRLRKKLQGADTGVAIETVRGLGYLLRELSE